MNKPKGKPNFVVWLLSQFISSLKEWWAIPLIRPLYFYVIFCMGALISMLFIDEHYLELLPIFILVAFGIAVMALVILAKYEEYKMANELYNIEGEMNKEWREHHD